MFKRITNFICIFLLLFLSGFSCSKTDHEIIKIGAALPLTGDGAVYGQYAKMAIDMAVDEINRSPQRKKRIKMIYEDTKLDPKESTNVVSKLITVDKAPVIIGPMASSSVKAVIPIATRNKVLIISPSATDHELSSSGGYFFRTVVSDIYEGEVMAKFAYNKMNYRRIGILYIGSAGPYGMAKAFEKFFIQLGGEIPLIEKGPQNTTDLRTQLSKLKGSDIDAIFFAGFAAETATMLKQAKELNIQKRILSHQPAEAPEVRERAGEAANGVIFATYTIDPESSPAEVNDFIAKFHKRYGKEPQNFAANAYDALRILVSVIDQYGFDSQLIINGLHEVKNYQGATGSISFDEQGDVIQPLRIMTIRNMEVVPFEQ